MKEIFCWSKQRIQQQHSAFLNAELGEPERHWILLIKLRVLSTSGESSSVNGAFSSCESGGNNEKLHRFLSWQLHVAQGLVDLLECFFSGGRGGGLSDGVFLARILTLAGPTVQFQVLKWTQLMGMLKSYPDTMPVNEWADTCIVFIALVSARVIVHKNEPKLFITFPPMFLYFQLQFLLKKPPPPPPLNGTENIASYKGDPWNLNSSGVFSCFPTAYQMSGYFTWHSVGRRTYFVGSGRRQRGTTCSLGRLGQPSPLETVLFHTFWVNWL